MTTPSLPASGEVGELELRADHYFAIVPEWVLYHPHLSDRSVRIYGFLARRAGESGQAMPGRRWLADKAQCSRASVDRTIKELEAVGAICRRRVRSAAGDYDRTIYTVHAIPCPGACSPGEPLPLDFGGASPMTRGSFTPEATGRRAHDEGVASPVSHIRESPEEESPTSSSGADSAVTDDASPDLQPFLFDAIARAFYPSGELAPQTRKRIGRVARELAATGAQPDDVAARYAAWSDLWPASGKAVPTVTVEALLKWWNDLGELIRIKSSPTVADCTTCHGRGIVIALEGGPYVAVDSDDAWRSDVTALCPDPIHKRGDSR